MNGNRVMSRGSLKSHEKRHTCIQCHKLIPKGKSFIVLYDANVSYVYYFCSLRHLILWWIENKIISSITRKVRWV
jgi:hypothetical protein